MSRNNRGSFGGVTVGNGWMRNNPDLVYPDGHELMDDATLGAALTYKTDENLTYHILEEDGRFSVKSVDHEGYPSHSVLAGQPIIRFIQSFDTVTLAQEVFPTALQSHAMMLPMNTYDHLSDESDDDEFPYPDI
jgi:hypothetical protein